MRAEVGCLTRNIVIKGDDYSVETQYGGHLIMLGKGDEGTQGRIE